jgi:hypothetical protein
MVSGYVYHYVIKISDIVFSSNCNVYIKVKGKDYIIYRDNDTWWLQTPFSVCKILLFTVDYKVLSVLIDGECKLSEDWTLLNQWEKEVR